MQIFSMAVQRDNVFSISILCIMLMPNLSLYMSEQFGAILRAVAQAEQVANGIRGTSEIMSDLAGQTVVLGESATLAQDGRIIN